MRLHFRSDLVGVALVGATPLHLLSQTALPLKSPTGAFVAAQTRACLWQAEQAHISGKEKQSVPDGERPAVHIAIVCGFWQGASGRAHPIFVLFSIF